MSGPVVAVPLRVERAVLARRLPGTRLLRTGMGPARAAHRTRARLDGAAAVLVAGVAGGLDPRLAAGDVVVADELRGAGAPVACPSAPLLAAALRRHGLTVHVGPMRTGDTLVRGARRAELAATGALAADMESAAVAAAAGVPVAAVRAVADTPRSPLLSPGAAVAGVRALAALRRSAPALREWLAATGPREVLLAGPRSARAWLERAVQVVERAPERAAGPVHVRRQNVHDAHVVPELETRGALFVQEVEELRAVREVAAASDLVLVLGSRNSSDSQRLAEVAERAGTPARLVDDAAGVDLRWLAGAPRVGVTAGASAPPHLVDDLVVALSGLGPVTVTAVGGPAEDIPFALPKEAS